MPSRAATSGLSPHLRFGEISPAYLWRETARFADAHPAAAADAWAFLRQLLWRDFAWHRLYYLPEMAEKNVRSQFNEFPWAWSSKADPGASKSAFAHMDMEPDEDARQHLDELAAWQKGETGIPLVDAGMRELWATGTMHNRVRMVVGSWLTKNLGIHWRHGEEWFWDTLVDADYASNPFNWQWVAGCGDDAAPYFRIFNPLLQVEKFDPDGLYVNRWVPERHTPLYPEPMVDVKESRKTALAAYNDIRNVAKG
ncbi:FAD-binding domain-containing protein [Corynebacterium urinipleomorphum]|uniref:FAD-binding domain-containing protein n=1 Tax=Corynebacterium urinipleomorphum TaxID=1852380 RepID=UPI002E2674D6